MGQKGYYSQPLATLPGRLHVTQERISLELVLRDRNGKKGIASMTLDQGSGTSLTADWKDCCNRSANGESGEVDTGERILITGPRPEITIFKGFGNLKSGDAVAAIADEIGKAYRRGEEVQTAIFHSEDNKDTAKEDEKDMADKPIEERQERKKRPRIQRDRQDRQGRVTNPENSVPGMTKDETPGGIEVPLEEKDGIPVATRCPCRAN